MSKYTLDDDTRELLEIILNWSAHYTELQAHEETQQDMAALIQETAQAFGIPYKTVHVEEIENPDGTVKLDVTISDSDTEEEDFPDPPEDTLH